MSVKTYLRKGKNGKSKIYVDYRINGERHRKKTEMFLYDKPKSNIEKEHNKKTKKLEEIYVSKLVLKIQNNELGIKAPKRKVKDFVKYYSILTEQRKDTGKNFDTWRSALNHLKKFEPNGIQFHNMDVNWLERFRHFLTNNQNLKSASACNYFNVVKHGIHDAFRERLIDINIADLVQGPKVESAIRQFLTEEEVVKLEETECANKILKKAFLFACKTGMSFADIKSLCWKDIKINHEGRHYIDFHRKKTKGLQNHPISNQAKEILGIDGDKNELVFKDLKYNSWMNTMLREWVYKAGIKKTITFHCARHSYATMLLHKGAKITTVGKLLGHKNIKTTMIYAKVMDSDMRDAAELMDF